MTIVEPTTTVARRQAKGVLLTPIDRFYGFTHTGDDQHIWAGA